MEHKPVKAPKSSMNLRKKWKDVLRSTVGKLSQTSQQYWQIKCTNYNPESTQKIFNHTTFYVLSLSEVWREVFCLIFNWNFCKKNETTITLLIK